MPPPPEASSGAPAEDPLDGLPRVRAPRHVLWLLLVPAVLYCAAPIVANRIEPRVLGVPFLLVWIIGATVLSPVVIWIVSRFDPAYRAGAVEPVPVDDAAGPKGAADAGRGDR